LFRRLLRRGLLLRRELLRGLLLLQLLLALALLLQLLLARWAADACASARVRWRRASDGCALSAFSISAYRRCASAKSPRSRLCSVAITAIGIRSVSALDTPASPGCLSRSAR
jgi:hypothetical protein